MKEDNVEIKALVFSDGKGDEFLRITQNGIVFNRSLYNFTEEEFANKFVEILEKNFEVEFKYKRNGDEKG